MKCSMHTGMNGIKIGLKSADLEVDVENHDIFIVNESLVKTSQHLHTRADISHPEICSVPMSIFRFRRRSATILFGLGH